MRVAVVVVVIASQAPWTIISGNTLIALVITTIDTNRAIEARRMGVFSSKGMLVVAVLHASSSSQEITDRHLFRTSQVTLDTRDALYTMVLVQTPLTFQATRLALIFQGGVVARFTHKLTVLVVDEAEVVITILHACVSLSVHGQARSLVALHTVAPGIPVTARFDGTVAILIDEVRRCTGLAHVAKRTATFSAVGQGVPAYVTGGVVKVLDASREGGFMWVVVLSRELHILNFAATTRGDLTVWAMVCRHVSHAGMTGP